MPKRKRGEPAVGHNHIGEDGREKLRSLVARVENLNEQKAAIADDIRSIYAEAKSAGYDVRALREVIKRRKADPEEMREHDAIVEAYMQVFAQLESQVAAMEHDIARRGTFAHEDRRAGPDA